MTAPPDPSLQRLLAANAAANDFFHAHLLDEPRALAYLSSRGVVAADAHHPPWTIGWAPAGWTVLRDHLRAAGFSDAELLTAGLVTKARTNNLIDVFRGRVMFPVRNRDGQVVAFTGRDLTGRDGTPKYRNSTTTAIYQKKAVLYGLAEQLRPGTAPAAVMLVEGPADVVAVAGLRQRLSTDAYPDAYLAVAPCGTALTGEQVALLAAAVPAGTPIVVAFDADSAGQAAIDRSYQLLRDWPGPVQAMALPAGSDPAALVAAGPAAAVAAFTRARVPLTELVVLHRVAPHLDRIARRMAELERIGRDPALESRMMRLDAIHAVAPLVIEVADTDPHQAARLAMTLATELQVDPLTVFEVVYPPADEQSDPISTGPADPPAPDPSPAAEDRPPPIALPGGGFPLPDAVGHEYARVCPPESGAALWVEHDPRTGHSAWVLAEAVQDTEPDRAAARLAAEVAGRVAVVVGAQQAVAIARTAVNASAPPPGDASITVLTSFDGDQPRPGADRFTLAWAGDTRAFAAAGRWFAPVSTEHTSRATRGPAEQARAAFLARLTALTGRADRPVGAQDRALAQASGRAGWLASADGADLAGAWHTAHRLAPVVGAAAAAAAEQRVRQLYPDVAERYAGARAGGADALTALRTTAAEYAAAAPRPGDGLLTASVRHGAIGVNRLDLPVTQLVLAGRGLARVPDDRLREAIGGHAPRAALDRLADLATGTAALVIRPRPQAVTAARLAAQGQAAAAVAGPLPLPAGARRLALPAAAPRSGPAR